MREKHDVTRRNLVPINLQLYNVSTNASIVALVRSCETTELHKVVNFWTTTVLSSLILLKEYFNNRNE
jgi:hypothetical protein